MIKLFYIFLVLFIVGCSTKDEVVVQKTLPSWYKNEPLDTKDEFFSVGEGVDKQSSIIEALNNLAQRINTSLESEFVLKQKVIDGYINKTQATSSIKTQVKKIHFSSYEVLESRELGFKRVATLIKLDKLKEALALKNSFLQDFSLTQKELDTLDGLNIAQKLRVYKNIESRFDDALMRLTFISLLDESFNQNEYLNKVQYFMQLHKRFKQQLTYKIENGSNTKLYNPVLASHLSVKGMQQIQGAKSSYLVIRLSSSINRLYSYGFYILKSELIIEVLDAQKNLISSNRVVLDSHSSREYDEASLAQKLEEIIKQDGISKVLSLEL